MSAYDYAIRYVAHDGTEGYTKPRQHTSPKAIVWGQGFARAQGKPYREVEQVRRVPGTESWEPCDPNEEPPWSDEDWERLRAHARAAAEPARDEQMRAEGRVQADNATLWHTTCVNCANLYDQLMGERERGAAGERNRIARALRALTTDGHRSTLTPRDEALAAVVGETGGGR